MLVNPLIFNLEDASQRYLAGETCQQLAAQFGVGRKWLDTRLRRAGVQMRTRSEACLLRSSKFTLKQRLAHAEKAHAARRGGKNGPVMGTRRAQTIERYGMPSHRDESLLAFWLAKRGHIATLQKAIGTYNVDLGFETSRIAVEINGSAHLPRNLGDSFPLERLKYILDSGWRVIEIITWPKRYSLRATCADYVVPLLELPHWDESASSQHVVITGRGEPLPCTGFNANNWTAIQRAVRFQDTTWRNGKRVPNEAVP